MLDGTATAPMLPLSVPHLADAACRADGVVMEPKQPALRQEAEPDAERGFGRL